MRHRFPRFPSAAWPTFAALLLLAPLAQAELKVPRVSPKGVVTQTIGLTDVTVTYSRPGVKSRTIWGELVPYGQPWRTGANEATTLTITEDITFGGTKLAAGTYALLTIPAKDEWTVVVNKDKELWGANGYKTENDVVRVKVKPQAAPHQEWLSFGFENLALASGDLVMRWEKLMIPVRIEVDVVEKTLASARTEVAAAKADDWRTPMRAADFCLNANTNVDEGLQWAEKSVKVEENYFNMSVLARLHAKKGDTAKAISTAEKAVALGKASKDPVDTKPTERLIADWSKTKKT